MVLTDKQIKKFVPEIKKELGIKIYAPMRYFQGLKTKAQMKTRIKTMHSHIQEAKKKPTLKKFVKPFKTDKGIKTKKSSWTTQFYKKYGKKIEELKEKHKNWDHFMRVSKVTGIKKRILKEAYDRGVAAYKTGHRPGATAEQWGWARMYSLIIRHKRASLTHDKDLASLILATGGSHK